MRTLVAIVVVAGCAALPPPATPPANVAPSRAVRPVSAGDDSLYAGLDTSWQSGTATPLDPYLNQLALELRQNLRVPPTADEDVQPVACVHVTPTGVVAEAKLKTSSGDAAIDESVEQALEALKFNRNEHAIPVPNNLLVAAKRWLCFPVALD